MLLVNTPVQAKSLLHNLEQARGIGLYMNVCFKWEGAIPILSGLPLKLLDKFTYLGSNISSSDVNIHLVKDWTTRDSLSIIWKSYISDKRKEDFFSAIAV